MCVDCVSLKPLDPIICSAHDPRHFHMIIMSTATCSGPRSAAIWSAAETPSTWRRFNGEDADVTEGCCKYSIHDLQSTSLIICVPVEGMRGGRESKTEDLLEGKMLPN